MLTDVVDIVVEHMIQTLVVVSSQNNNTHNYVNMILTSDSTNRHIVDRTSVMLLRSCDPMPLDSID